MTVTYKPPFKYTPLCLYFFNNSMKPEKNGWNMRCHPLLSYAESFEALPHRKVDLKSIITFVQNRQEIKFIKNA